MSFGVTPASANAGGPDQTPAGIGQVEILAAARALQRLAGADHPHQRLLQALGDLRRGHDQRAAAVGDDAAIQPVQRIGDHRRVEHVLDGDDVAQHRVRVVLRVMRGRDLDPGQLLAGGAVVVHVAHGAHAVDVVGGGAVGGLEIGLGAVPPRGGIAAGARLAGQRDQRDRALAGGDRLGGMAEMDQIGTAAGIGGIEVAHLQAEVIDHRQRPAGRVAGAEIAVDVGLGQPGVLERALGDLGMQLRGRFVGCVPGRMLVDPGQIGLALDAQYGSPLVFLPGGFCGLSGRPWQAPKYSVGRDVASSSLRTQGPIATNVRSWIKLVLQLSQN